MNHFKIQIITVYKVKLLAKKKTKTKWTHLLDQSKMRPPSD